jgi:hypothetical protein
MDVKVVDLLDTLKVLEVVVEDHVETNKVGVVEVVLVVAQLGDTSLDKVDNMDNFIVDLVETHIMVVS